MFCFNLHIKPQQNPSNKYGGSFCQSFFNHFACVTNYSSQEVSALYNKEATNIFTCSFVVIDKNYAICVSSALQ